MENTKILEGENTKIMEVIKNMLEESESFTSISLRKITFERFQNIKQKIERITGKKMNNDEMMNLILDFMKREFEK